RHTVLTRYAYCLIAWRIWQRVKVAFPGFPGWKEIVFVLVFQMDEEISRTKLQDLFRRFFDQILKTSIPGFAHNLLYLVIYDLYLIPLDGSVEDKKRYEHKQKKGT